MRHGAGGLDKKRWLDRLARRLSAVETGRKRAEIAYKLCFYGDPRGLDVLWSYYKDMPEYVVDGLSWFVKECSDEDFVKHVNKVYSWLREALRSDWIEAREKAVYGLCEIAMRDPRYRDDILRILDKVALKDSWYEVRDAALASIVAIKYGWKKVDELDRLSNRLERMRDVDGLLNLLDSSEPYARSNAAWSLYRLCKSVDRSLCKYLFKLVNDKYPCLRLIGLRAYWLYFGEKAKDVLMKLVCDEHPEVRVEAARYLLELARKGALSKEEIKFIEGKLYEILSGDVDEIIEDDAENLLDELRDFL